MADLLDRIRQQISTRLSELRPLVDEQRRLEAALHALGDPVAAHADAAPARGRRQRKAATRSTTPVEKRKRAPRGANRAAVLRAVGDRPGATSAELAARSGVQRNTLNTLLSRLVKEGELQTRALPTGKTGYALRAARSEAPTDAPPTGPPRAG